MPVKVGINGFGRIGRLAFRLMFDNEDFEIVAINTRTTSTIAYLLKYDTAQGKYDKEISYDGTHLIVDGQKIRVFTETEAPNIPWGEAGADVVIESTGKHNTYDAAYEHIVAGAKKVLVSAPAKGDVKTIVYNINHDILDGTEQVISGASCTTNCLAPVAKVLNDVFGIEKGLMSTVHAYTTDQRLLDNSHPKDFRRARAAAANIVPTTTGAASAVGKVIPQLAGKLDGIALRVPTITGSLVDLVVELKKNVTVEEINAAMKAAANETLHYTEEEIVSSDVIGVEAGGVFDAKATSVLEVDGKQLVKVLVWYDNEMGYTSQLVRLAKYVGNQIK
ncbi:MAG: type I glyceraldehyde-3-phosphate dehydrogenase [Eubacteriaceae bacterium]|jgi:glyceraldehyde 3-phosphate dehydrogenase|nr:type I glyceraldehyde-3-phosphate dehydrogenase [Eubacteriaceae bacterium]